MQASGTAVKMKETDGEVCRHGEDGRHYDPLTGGSLTQTRRFCDGSGIAYYDNGYVVISAVPQPLTDARPAPPLAQLYYWQVMQGRADVETWDDIKAAERAEKGAVFNV